jgi:hypothetical protein
VQLTAIVTSGPLPNDLLHEAIYTLESGIQTSLQMIAGPMSFGAVIDQAREAGLEYPVRNEMALIKKIKGSTFMPSHQ